MPRVARAVTMVEREGRRIAALVHDPAVTDESRWCGPCRGRGLQLENERLQADLFQLEEGRASRARIVEATRTNDGGSSATFTTAPSSGWSRSR